MRTGVRLYFIIVLYIILIQLSGCATKSVTSDENKNFAISVEIEKKEVAPSVIEKEVGIGPQFKRNVGVANGAVGRVAAVNFSESGMLAISYVGFIKAIEQQEREYHIVTGSGFGALIAAFYCAGKPSDQIEWYLYKLSGELRSTDEKFLSPEWLKIVEKSLYEQFHSSTLQSFKRSCLFPVYNAKSKMIEYKSRGPVVPILIANLTLHTKNEKDKSPIIYQTELSQELRRFGGEDLTMVCANTSAFHFNKWDDYLLGIYGKVSALNQIEQKNYDHLLEFKTDDIAIDSVDQFPQLIQMGMNATQEWLEAQPEAANFESRGMDEE